MTVHVAQAAPWSERLVDDIYIVGPGAMDSQLVLPGPRQTPRRPPVAFSVGPGGIVILPLDAGGSPMDRAVLQGGAVVELPFAPLAAALRSDGALWLLDRDSVHLFSTSGSARRIASITGQRLLPGSGDGAWVFGASEAQWISGDGTSMAPVAWGAPTESIVVQGALCRLVDRGASLRCASAAGRVSTTPAPPGIGPFERLVARRGDRWVTQTAGDLIVRDGGRVIRRTLAGAGESTSGEPFVALRSDGGLELHVGTEPERLLRWPQGSGSPPQGATVVAVDGARALVYARDRAAWIEGDAQGEIFTVDAKTYASAVFPHAWLLSSPFPAVSGSDSDILLPTTGPGGMLVVAVRVSGVE